MRNLNKGSLAESILITIAQMRVVSRRMLGAVMYYYDSERDSTEKYSGKPVGLTKALNRIKERGYVDTINDGDTEYLFLTETGINYLKERGAYPCEDSFEKSPKNEKERKKLIAHAYALYLGRSMRIFSFAEEKPSFAEFAAQLGAPTFFRFSQSASFEARFSKDEIEQEILPYGVCYSKYEIRSAYGETHSHALDNNTSRRIGMIFKTGSITTLFMMDKKITAFWKRQERDFDHIIEQDLVALYAKANEIKRKAYVYADSFLSMPTFFHGTYDGVEKNAYTSEEDSRSEMSTLKIDKMLDYNAIYLMPKRSKFVQYREDLDAYSEDMEQEDFDNFRDTHPGVTGPIVICRYPNLLKLRKHYKAKDTVTLVGPGDPLMVDMLSRCMRTYLKEYYDINTGKPVQFTRYSSTGRPRVGNTQQIDHSKKATINGKDFWGKSALV